MINFPPDRPVLLASLLAIGGWLCFAPASGDLRAQQFSGSTSATFPDSRPVSPVATNPPLPRAQPVEEAVPAVEGVRNPGRGEPGGPPAQRESVGIPQINVIDKFLATEYALASALNRFDQTEWAREYKDLYDRFKVDGSPGTIDGVGRVGKCMALGVRATDGVLALKARNVEDLNDCAEDIEKLAHSLGVDPVFLQKANIVKHHAGRQEWIEAFMHLGYLQQDVMRRLDMNAEERNDAVLVIMGGWLQGGRIMTHVILEYYDKATPDTRVHISNILREPQLVALMIRELDKLDDEVKQDPRFAPVLEFLPTVFEKINIGMHDAIAKEDVAALHAEFDRLVRLTVNPAGAVE